MVSRSAVRPPSAVSHASGIGGSAEELRPGREEFLRPGNAVAVARRRPTAAEGARGPSGRACGPRGRRCSLACDMHRPGLSAAAATPAAAIRFARRRVVALVVLVTLVLSPSGRLTPFPARRRRRSRQRRRSRPSAAPPSPTRRVVVARVEGRGRALPVAREVTTAVAFHPVDNGDAWRSRRCGDRAQRRRPGPASSPTSSPAAAACSTTSWTVPAASVLFDRRPRHRCRPRSRSSSARSTARSRRSRSTSILGRYDDVEIDIQLDRDPSLLLLITHVATSRSQIGDVVAARRHPLGERARFPRGARAGAQPVHLGQRRSRAAHGAARGAGAGGL